MFLPWPSTQKRSRPIEVRARHTLVDLSPEAKEAELVGLLQQVLQIRVTFTKADELTDAALEQVRGVAEMLVEYPEVDVVLDGFFRQSKGSSQVRLMEVVKNRADICKNKLIELGCTCDMSTAGRAAERRGDAGCVGIFPLQTQLMRPKERLVRVISRSPITFVARTSTLSSGGQRVLRYCARVAREMEHCLVLSCSDVARTDHGIPSLQPERLARSRLRAIQESLQASGATNELRYVLHYTDDEQAPAVFALDVDDELELRPLTNLLAPPCPEAKAEQEPNVSVFEPGAPSTDGGGAVAVATCRPQGCFPSCSVDSRA